MITATHRHLCLTPADACYAKPTRHMPDDEFSAYVHSRLFGNQSLGHAGLGFDRSRPFTITKSLGFTVISQELTEEEKAAQAA